MKTRHLSIIVIACVVTALIFYLVPNTVDGSINTPAVQQMSYQISIPKNECNQNQTFGPAQTPIIAGLMHWPLPSTENVRGLGFSKTIHVKLFSYNYSNFILEPGHTGQITYTVFVKSDGFDLKNLTWISNNVEFMHRAADTYVKQDITDAGNYTFDNGTTKHMWSFCDSPQPGEHYCGIKYDQRPSDTTPFETIAFDHPGISVSYLPSSELVGIVPITVTAILSADDTAPQGTYWLFLSPGQNNGGPQVLLTIGKCSHI
ncbi:MAG: hypothetical protein ACREAT_00070 [Nitrosotalea sp.]